MLCMSTPHLFRHVPEIKSPCQFAHTDTIREFYCLSYLKVTDCFLHSMKRYTFIKLEEK